MLSGEHPLAGHPSESTPPLTGSLSPRSPKSEIRALTRRLILFNKPYGVLCQFSGDGTVRPTRAGFIDVRGVYPAGRLDLDSEGLLLLTDDGRLQARIADPKFKLPKTYLVQVEGDVQEAALEQLRRGIRLKDGMTLPAEAARIDAPDLWPRDPPVRFRQTVPDCCMSLPLRE